MKFAGMRITKDGCTPDPERMEAVEQFRRPETKSQVRQLLGLCQQFSQWVPDMAPATVNMRSLLRKSTAFVWTAECQEEFIQMKKVLTDERFIKAYNPDLYTELLVDTSKIAGCGCILIQRTEEGVVHIIRCGSLAAKKRLGFDGNYPSGSYRYWMGS